LIGSALFLADVLIQKYKIFNLRRATYYMTKFILANIIFF
jgi:hypothetical protein